MKIDTKQRDFSEPQNEGVHGIVFPADVRESDMVSARLRKAGDPDFAAFSVWRLSPLGIELVAPEGATFTAGDVVDLELTIGLEISRFQGLVVQSGAVSSNRRIVGVRFSARRVNSLLGVDRRSGSRWICSSQYDPVAIAPNPAVFNDFIYFKIRDISRSGIRAITSLRNKYIVPGMELSLQISFPMTSQISIVMKVARIGLICERGKDYLEVGLAFTELSRTQREVIGQYLVQFSDAESLEAIRRDGFFPLSLSRGIDYQFIRTEEDFRCVLDLRLRANREVGKVPPHYSASDMADIFDTRSRILVGKYRGTIVGTIRLAFFEAGEKLEHELYVTLPASFPRSHEVLECSRAATDPKFRGSDLFFSMMLHIGIVALLAKRNWVVLSTTPELISMYKRLGFKEANLTYEHELYPGMTQVVLFANVRDGLLGVGVNPIYWNLVWRPLARYMTDREILRSSTRVKIYSLFAPLAVLVRYLAKNPRKRGIR